MGSLDAYESRSCRKALSQRVVPTGLGQGPYAPTAGGPGQQAAKAAACSSQASQGYLTTPSKPCPPSHCPRHHGRLTGSYSQAVASSKDGQLPHKDSGTKLAPCISPPCGHSYWEGHSQEKPHCAKAGKHLAGSACSAVPELPMLWWHSLQTMATQEGAKPLLNFRGAGVSEDQPSLLPPRQASQAARDRQRTVH